MVRWGARRFQSRDRKFQDHGQPHFARLVHTSTRLNDGQVLIAGGETNQNGRALGPAELFNPDTGKFTVAASLHFPRLFHTATILPSGIVLIVGGTTNAAVVGSAELYLP